MSAPAAPAAASGYLEWSARSELQARRRYAEKLLSLLPAGARVLELGAGAGSAASDILARRFRVASVAAAGASFDAVCAMYVLSVTPLRQLSGWLRQGGLLVANRQVTLEAPIEQGWSGAPLNFTRVDASDLLELISDAGLEPVWSEVISDEDEHGRPISYLWFIARKP